MRLLKCTFYLTFETAHSGVETVIVFQSATVVQASRIEAPLTSDKIIFSKYQQVVLPSEAPSSPAPPRGMYSSTLCLLDVNSAQAAVGAGFVGGMFDFFKPSSAYCQLCFSRVSPSSVGKKCN